MSDTLLSVHDLQRSFITGRTRIDVLKSVSFTVASGELVALTGISGVGKSTLLHLLGGLDRPSAGAIFFKGQDMNGFSDDEINTYRNREVGFVFQFHHLLPEFTALENVAMPLLIGRESRRTAVKTAGDLLAHVGLADRWDHKPGELSGGEQQRVALARALVANPSIVLADEPTGNLDEDTAQSVFDLICTLNRETGVTFFIATHNTRLAQSMSRWLRLSEGKVESMEDSGMN